MNKYRKTPGAIIRKDPAPAVRTQALGVGVFKLQAWCWGKDKGPEEKLDKRMKKHNLQV